MIVLAKMDFFEIVPTLDKNFLFFSSPNQIIFKVLKISKQTVYGISKKLPKKSFSIIFEYFSQGKDLK